MTSARRAGSHPHLREYIAAVPGTIPPYLMVVDVPRELIIWDGWNGFGGFPVHRLRNTPPTPAAGRPPTGIVHSIGPVLKGLRNLCQHISYTSADRVS